ncbi:MAG: glycosyltransferase family 4 protein [Limnobacter sp.]|nr:glycosyltransferase family 4 protein [Limnobacter sp.]
MCPTSLPPAAPPRKPVLFFANTDWYLHNFRSELLEETARIFECRPVAFVPNGDYVNTLKARGLKVCLARLDQRGINPFKDLLLLLQCLWVFFRESPQLVHLFTIKCVLYGGVAARLLRIPRVCAITGLGHLFISNSWKNRLIRSGIKPLFRFALGGKNARVVFQNTEDRDAYVQLGLVQLRHTELIRGSGVNLNLFKSLPPARNPVPVFLYVGRLLGEKGVHDLLEAADLLHKKRFEFELRLAGDVYPGNPSSLSHDELLMHQRKPYLRFLGHVANIQAEIARCEVVVLPSYREGTPKSLLEAAACSRAILCSDIAGNQGVVLPDVNGYYFPPGEVELMAEAMEMMIASPETIARYASNSRAVVERDFSTHIVVGKTLLAYIGLLGQNHPAAPCVQAFNHFDEV